MKSFLPDYKVSKLLLDSAHEAMPYYQYCKRENIIPFIDLNGKGGRPPVYKNDLTIDTDSVPLCLTVVACGAMVSKPLKKEPNLSVLKSAGKTVAFPVPAKIPALMPNMGAHFI